jgi:hypothetical protein
MRELGERFSCPILDRQRRFQGRKSTGIFRPRNDPGSFPAEVDSKGKLLLISARR